MSLGERFRSGRGVLAALRKTSKRTASSNNSSTPTKQRPLSMSEIYDNSSLTQNERVEERSTQSTSRSMASASSVPSSPNPEVEGDCELTFTLKIRTYGRYSKVEHTTAHHLAIALYRTFNDGWELRDELGRIVLFDAKAAFGSDEQIHYVEKPT